MINSGLVSKVAKNERVVFAAVEELAAQLGFQAEACIGVVDTSGEGVSFHATLNPTAPPRRSDINFDAVASWKWGTGKGHLADHANPTPIEGDCEWAGWIIYETTATIADGPDEIVFVIAAVSGYDQADDRRIADALATKLMVFVN